MKLDALRFVIGAVARKDYEESLCHLEIRNGRAIAYGGRIAMSTPIECPFDTMPHARSLVKAVQACSSDDIKLTMTPAGRLSVKSGKFKAFVNCLPPDTEMVRITPTGQYFDVSDEFMASIVALAPFMSIDASRPWAQGLRLGQFSTYATNNIILVQRWHGANFPVEVVIPADAVHELIRVGEKPVGVQVSEQTLTFYFPDKRWLCTHLIASDTGWDRTDAIFERNTNTDGITDVPEGLYEALDTLKPFLGDRGYVYLKGDHVATHAADGEGATVDIPVANGPIFHAMQLRALEKIATRINFTAYPRPVYFTGEKLRGVIVGIRE